MTTHPSRSPNRALALALAALLGLGLGLGLAACGDDDGAAADAGLDAAPGQDAALDAAPGQDAAPDAAPGQDATLDAAPGPDAGGTPLLDALLAALRADRDAALLAQSRASGWPAAVEGGYLVVCPDLPLAAGDHDAWAGTALNADAGFHWLVLALPAGSRYKCTDGAQAWVADPWSRAYAYDEYGEMSQVPPAGAHLERHFAVSGSGLDPRTVRVWLPVPPVTHVLYVHDGQNLFDPQAIWGGWHLADAPPAGMMLVGIDNTPARMDEYTHVQDLIDGTLVGGLGDDYADLVNGPVRDLVAQHYGEPGTVGTMGSSLGGLISLHVALRFPGEYAFAASLSGTMGWGSIGLTSGSENETMIERWAAAGHSATALYVDSGGGGTCYDSDGDGIEDDDPTAADNYCENRQLIDVLLSAGYVDDMDLFSYWDQDAEHNEAAWAARVWRPLDAFAAQ